MKRLLGGVTLVVLSCGDPSPVGVGSPGRAPQADLIGNLIGSPLPTGLLTCSPLASDSVTQTIGPEGGTIRVGPHTLSVPAGALDSSVTITAVAPSDTTNHVRFEPDGLVFRDHADLTMSYANCNLLGLSLPKQIAYTTDVLQILEYLKSVDNPPSQTVTGRLEHFSGYAVAW